MKSPGSEPELSGEQSERRIDPSTRRPQPQKKERGIPTGAACRDEGPKTGFRHNGAQHDLEPVPRRAKQFHGCPAPVTIALR